MLINKESRWKLIAAGGMDEAFFFFSKRDMECTSKSQTGWTGADLKVQGKKMKKVPLTKWNTPLRTCCVISSLLL